MTDEEDLNLQAQQVDSIFKTYRVEFDYARNPHLAVMECDHSIRSRRYVDGRMIKKDGKPYFFSVLSSHLQDDAVAHRAANSKALKLLAEILVTYDSSEAVLERRREDAEQLGSFLKNMLG